MATGVQKKTGQHRNQGSSCWPVRLGIWCKYWYFKCTTSALNDARYRVNRHIWQAKQNRSKVSKMARSEMRRRQT